jgi:hypothetical protein
MRLTAVTNLDAKADDEKFRLSLAKFVEQVAFIINGNLSITDLKVEKYSVNFPTALEEIGVSHNLGRVPVGYLVIGKSANMNVYNGVNNWTMKSLFLRSDAAGVATILVF